MRKVIKARLDSLPTTATPIEEIEAGKAAARELIPLALKEGLSLAEAVEAMAEVVDEINHVTN